MEVRAMALPQKTSLNDKLEREITDFANYDGSVDSATVVSCFRTAAAEFGLSIAQLPVNLWHIFNDFTGYPPTTRHRVQDVNRRIHVA